MCLKDKINKDIINLENKKTIEELFDMYADELYVLTDEDKKYTTEIIELEEKFYETLTEEKQEQFNNLSELKSENNSREDKKIFTIGYSLAVKLILESIS